MEAAFFNLHKNGFHLCLTERGFRIESYSNY